MSEPEGGSSPTEHDKRLRRAAHEAEMMKRVRAAGPNSTAACLLRKALLRDACGELMKLHRTNRLLPRVKALLRKTLMTPNKMLPPPPDDWQESAEAVIYISVKQSLDSFFENAIFGGGSCRWRQDGGASVQTYFVNKCLLTLKDVYLREHKIRCPDETLSANIAEEEDETTGSPLYPTPPEDPQSRAVLMDLIRRIGQEMTELELRIVWERFSGKSNEEIGRDLGMSADAVASRLYRLRLRVGSLSGARGTR
jgi:hypothetical protein